MRCPRVSSSAIATALALVGSVTLCATPEWRLLYDSAYAKAELDVANIQRLPTGRYLVTQRTIFKQPVPAWPPAADCLGCPLSSVLVKKATFWIEVDCAQKTGALRRTAIFDSENSTSPVAEGDEPSVVFRPAIREDEPMFLATCK